MKFPFVNNLVRSFFEPRGIEVFGGVPNDSEFKGYFDANFLKVYNVSEDVPDDVYDMHFNVAIRLNLLGVNEDVAVKQAVLYFKNNHINKDVDVVVSEIHNMLEIEIEQRTVFDMPTPRNNKSLFSTSEGK